jgi:protein SCO1/2
VNRLLELKSRARGLACFLALALAACAPSPTFKGTDLGAVDWGGDFTLSAHTGARASTADYRGKVVIIFFGYTHCPDICSPTLQKLALLMKRLGEDAARVQVLFITVDPRHDTPAVLAAFVPRFHPSFVGLTGTEEEIAAVAREYKVAFQANPQSPPGHTLIDHFGGMMVKDPTGRLRLLFKNEMSVEDMEHDIRLLLDRSPR